MQMSRADIRRFPEFAEYVSVRIPQVQHVSSIVNTIQRLAGTITRAEIRRALQWGHGPMIEIVHDLTVDGERVNGAFTPGTNVIQVDEERVTNFENHTNHRGRNARGELVFLVGVTLLHELTHWADDQDGVDNPLEEGDQYELDVYGQFVR